MIRSGIILGIISFVLVLVSATVISPLCAPCLGLILGLAAGYLSGVYDKPTSSSEAIRKGAIAGVIAGGIGFLGGLIGGVINGFLLNPSMLEALYKTFGLPNVAIDRTTVWVFQLGGAFCLGIFNIGWMAVLGLAGGVVWYQMIGRNQPMTVLPPQEPIPPSF